VFGPLTDTDVGVVMTRVALAADAIVSAVAPIKPKTRLRIQTSRTSSDLERHLTRMFVRAVTIS
jgi:hypothetical protein